MPVFNILPRCPNRDFYNKFACFRAFFHD